MLPKVRQKGQDIRFPQLEITEPVKLHHVLQY